MALTQLVSSLGIVLAARRELVNANADRILEASAVMQREGGCWGDVEGQDACMESILVVVASCCRQFLLSSIILVISDIRPCKAESTL